MKVLVKKKEMPDGSWEDDFDTAMMHIYDEYEAGALCGQLKNWTVHRHAVWVLEERSEEEVLEQDHLCYHCGKRHSPEKGPTPAEERWTHKLKSWNQAVTGARL